MKARTILAAMAAVLMTSAAANAAQVAALVGNDTIAWVDTVQKKATGTTKVTGISGALVGIDVRPADGMLYGLVDDGTVVTIAKDGKATMKSKLDTMVAKGVDRHRRLQPGCRPPARDRHRRHEPARQCR